MSWMEEDAHVLTNEEIVKQVIKPNVPWQVKTKFEIEYRNGMTLKEVGRILGLLLKEVNENEKKKPNGRDRASRFGGRNNSRNGNQRNKNDNNNYDNDNGGNNRGR